MRKVLTLMSVIILALFLPACTSEERLTREEWEALQSQTNPVISSTDTCPITTTTPAGIAMTRQTAATTQKALETPSTKKTPSTKVTPPISKPTSAAAPTTTSSLQRPTTTPTLSYEEQYDRLQRETYNILLQYSQEMDNLKAERDQIVIKLVQEENRINGEISSLKREKDAEIGRLLANSGGYESSAVRTAREQYDSRIASKQRELSAVQEKAKEEYAQKTAQMEAIQTKVIELDKNYNEAVAALKAQYGIQ